MNWSNTKQTFSGHTQISKILISQCVHCYKQCFWLKVENGEDDKDSENGILLFPKDSKAPMPHPDMPADIRKEYLEARNIVNDSPRGASALLRLAVQKICIHLGENGKNLNDAIGSLTRKGLPVEIQQALDIVRVIGNNAVHPGKISENDVADIADTLFELLNLIVEETISRPKKMNNLFSRLPETAKIEIIKRDA